MRYDVTDRDSPTPDPRPTARERRLLRYAARQAEALGLRDWTVVTQKGEVGEDIIAHAEMAYGRKVATITFGPRFFASPREEQRATVAHELLHAHLDGPATVLRDIETQLGTLQWEIVHETYRRRSEEACDAIAEAVAKWLPLPPA